jgi:hypothetical protein
MGIASSRWLPLLGVVGGIMLLMVGLAWTFRHALQLSPDIVMVDYQLYAKASRALMDGGDPYQYRTTSDDGHVFYGYVYPPIVAWALAPIVGLLSFTAGYSLWIMICVAAFASSLVVLLRAFHSPVSWWIVSLAVGAGSLTYLVRENLYHGQIDVILLLFVACGLTLLIRGQQVPAGVLLGLAASGKPFLGILLLLLLWRGQFKSAVSMVATGAVLLVLGFLPTLVNGTAVIESWIGVSRYASSPAFAAFPANHAISALFLRLFTSTPFAAPWIESQTALLLADAILVGVIVVAWALTVPFGTGPIQETGSDLVAAPGLLLFAECGQLLGLLYAFGPLAEANHFFMLLPGMIGTIRLATASPNREVRRRWLPAAVAWTVLFVAIASPLRQFSLASPIEQYVSGPTVLLTGRLGLLLLAVALTASWSRWREARASAVTVAKMVPATS